MSSTTNHGPTRVWAAVLFTVGAAAACGPGEPWPPVDPEPECITAADCDAQTSVCEASACADGQCLLQPAARGTPCDDGLFCTANQVCDGQGACGNGRSPCNEFVPGLPRCNEAQLLCEVCSDGRALVNDQCRCPFWNCLNRGGATYCAETDRTEDNQAYCFYDGLTIDDLPPLGFTRPPDARAR